MDHDGRSTPDLRFLLEPRSIAIVGASAKQGRISAFPHLLLAQHGFTGGVHLVNPAHDSINGVPCVDSVLDIAGEVDVAFVLVPARGVPDVLRDCGAKGVRFAVIASSGFAEHGGDAQEALDKARTECPGLRVLGPNSEGLMNVGAAVPVTFSRTVDYDRGLVELVAGDVAVVSQSGGIGFALFHDGLSRGLGFSHVVTTGNEADIDVTALALHLLTRPDTNVVVLFVEGLAPSHQLGEVLRTAREAGKVVLVCKVGRSVAGQRAALSHTAHLAGDAASFDAFVTGHGGMVAHDQEEVIDLALCFSRTVGGMAGRRVGVVSPSGGAATWLTDSLEEAGLEVPLLSTGLRERIDALIPAYGSSANPVDITGQMSVGGGSINGILELVASSGEVDALAIVATLAGAESLRNDREAIAAFVRDSGIPVVLYSYTRPAAWAAELMRDLGLAYYTSPGRCARALRAFADYRAWTSLATEGPGAAPAAAALPARESPMLTEPETLDLLRAWGLATTESVVARSPAEVAQAVARSGGPVALKLVSRAVPHKSEFGGVRLGVTDAEEAERIAWAWTERLAEVAGDVAFVVQPMAEPGIEAIVGGRIDPLLGPMVVVGAGGVQAELFEDSVIAPAPVSSEGADRLIGRLKLAVLLAGHRGRPAADRAALADVVAGVSRLVAAHAEDLAELDCNPVIVHAAGDGCTVVDALAVRAGSREDDP